MGSASLGRVHKLLADARLTAACVAVAGAVPELRRFAAGVFALAGAEKALVVAIDPHLLGANGRANQHLDAIPGGAQWFDYAAAAIANSWTGDQGETLRWWRAAADAVPAGEPYLGVATRERHAHHALIFGSLAEAQSVCDAALAGAVAHGLEQWQRLCSAISAGLAAATGDVARAERLVRDAAGQSAGIRALFAPVGARLALASGDERGLQTWAGPDVLEVALDAFELRASIGAALACVQTAAQTGNGALTCAALRRALIRCDGAVDAPELFSLAARFGDADDAAFGLDSLRAVLAPHRPYLHAHYLLARAHWCSRFGKRADAVDSAGDAARAFDAMGFRCWTDEAMNLLVHDDAAGAVPPRRRPSALSLTGREQQVAHLIRRGASNREVAHTLQISEHTVERHVSSILSRLGLRSRWQIVDLRTPAAE